MKNKKLKSGPGSYRGIKYGQYCCNTASMNIEIPLYIDKLLVHNVVHKPNPFGFNDKIPQIDFPKHIQDEIDEALATLRNVYVDDKEFVEMFSMNIETTPTHRRTLKEVKYYNANFLTIYWCCNNNLSFTHGTVMHFMEKFRSRIHSIFKKYKTKHKEKRVITSSYKISIPNIGELPF